MLFILAAAIVGIVPVYSRPLPSPVHPVAVRIAINDAEIFGTLDAASAGEIEAARLASTKAASKAVRDYADMLVRDHQAARKAGADLARQIGVTPVPPSDNSMATAHAQEIARLNQVSGAAFDKAFVEAMVADHRMVIDKVNGTLMPAAQNAALKDWMRKLLPTLQDHLTRGEALNK
jgi:putative membrane protein